MKPTLFISALAFSVAAVSAESSTSTGDLFARDYEPALDKRTFNWGSNIWNPLCWLGKCPDYNSDCNNCGSQGHKCWVENGTPKCEHGQCGIQSCNNGYVQQGDKCVPQQQWNDCDNCGSQGHKCQVENGTPKCEHGQCGIQSCNDGYVQQGDKCVPQQQWNDCDNCGSQGHKCQVENGTPKCEHGQCGIQSCNDGYVQQGDKCVAQQQWNDCDNCGSQGHKCQVENGTPKCEHGQCGIQSCNDGYVQQGDKCVPQQTQPQPKPQPKDCKAIHGLGWDWDPLGLFCRDCRSDTQNCGKCGLTCNIPNAIKSVCILGECKALWCAPGYHLSSGGCSKRWAKMHKRRLD